MNEPEFTVGIEEEYFLVDPQTRDLARGRSSSVIDHCRKTLGEHVTGEFLNSQVEIGTRVCGTIESAREQVRKSRDAVAKAAKREGMAMLAAATHPFARWQDQQKTDQDRYEKLSHDMQAVSHRLAICGMHVHIGISDDELRIVLMNQMRYFLPHLLALSTSSPFWQGRDTGLKSYRLSVFDGLPRSGLPPFFPTWGDYQHEVDMLGKTGVLTDPTKIWWDIRPHTKFPTLEVRICDVCTRLDDAISVAALCVCLCRMLYRLHCGNTGWRIYSRFLLSENRWRAQRYGTTGSLIDYGIGQLVAFEDLVNEILDLVAQDAEALGCVAEIEHVRAIVKRGSSANRQIAWYEEAGGADAAHNDAAATVVSRLMEETVDF